MSHFAQDSFKLDASLGQLIHLLNQYKDRLLNEHPAMDGITAAQFKLLLLLGRAGSMTPGELRQSLQVDSGAITRMLDRLERKDLLRRSHSAADRRRIDVTLTSPGQAFARRIPAIAADTLNQLTACLDHAEVEELMRLLRKILLNGNMLPATGERQ